MQQDPAISRGAPRVGASENAASFWLWPNLLSLDAPFVAILWQDLLARATATPLHLPGRLVLGLTVWAIYIADHLLDLRVPARDDERCVRHFYRRHQRFARFSLAAILAADISVIVFTLSPALLPVGLAVAVPVAVYLMLFTGRPAFLWKSLSAAVLFTAGVFTIAWSRSVQPLHTLIWPALAYAGLCEANLALIKLWDQEREIRRAPAILLFFGLLCVTTGQSGWYVAIALSAAALAMLAHFAERFPAEARRVLADAALLSPLLIRFVPGLVK